MKRIRVSEKLFDKIKKSDDPWRVIVDNVDFPLSHFHLDRVDVGKNRVYVHDVGVNYSDNSFFIEMRRRRNGNS